MYPALPFSKTPVASSFEILGQGLDLAQPAPIGFALKHARATAGLSQNGLASKLERRRTFLSFLESTPKVQRRGFAALDEEALDQVRRFIGWSHKDMAQQKIAAILADELSTQIEKTLTQTFKPTLLKLPLQGGVLWRFANGVYTQSDLKLLTYQDVVELFDILSWSPEDLTDADLSRLSGAYRARFYQAATRLKASIGFR